MLAQANLMYGGVTLEELDRLGEARRKVLFKIIFSILSGYFDLFIESK